MELKYIIIIILVFVLLWLNFLASLAIKNDDTLEKMQVMGQSIIVWLIPYLGAIIVLKFICTYSPKVIQKSWVPWPFKYFIFGAVIKNKGGKDGVKVIGSNDNGSDLGGGDGGGGS